MKKIKKFTTSLVVLLLASIVSNIAIAKSISITGNTADEAIVTDNSGVDFTGKETNRWQYYNVSYNWAIPNNTNIVAGDTAKFELPNNVQILKDTTFSVTNKDGYTVGTFQIKAGEQTGTLTFNDYLSNHPMDDTHGTLSFKVNGTTITTSKDWLINKYGWLDSNNKPYWSIVYNPDSINLTNVTIKDNLQGEHQLDLDSIQIEYGTVDSNNDFLVTSIEKNPQQYINQTDNGFEINFPKLDTAVRITYTTTPTNSSGNINIGNTVTGTASEIESASDSTSIQVGGDGSIDGSVPSNSSSETTSSDETTSSSETTSSDETTSSSEITSSDETTSSSETTSSDETTSSSEITSSDETTSSSEITSSDETTSSSEITSSDETASSSETTSSNKSKTVLINNSNDKNRTKNYENKSLPKTGSNKTSTLLFSVLGIAIVIGIITFTIHKKR